VEAKERGDAEVEVWGSGTATREFLYVDDAAEGILYAAERYDGEEPVNLGSGEEIGVKELVELIASLVGFSGSIRWNSSKPDGQPRRHLDTSLAKRAFGFEARTPLRRGLEQTIAWYLDHRDVAEAASL
jgi:nucleoside-diphosphate-sugar epimerase